MRYGIEEEKKLPTDRHLLRENSTKYGQSRKSNRRSTGRTPRLGGKASKNKKAREVTFFRALQLEPVSAGNTKEECRLLPLIGVKVPPG